MGRRARRGPDGTAGNMATAESLIEEYDTQLMVHAERRKSVTAEAEQVRMEYRR